MHAIRLSEKYNSGSDSFKRHWRWGREVYSGHMTLLKSMSITRGYSFSYRFTPMHCGLVAMSSARCESATGSYLYDPKRVTFEPERNITPSGVFMRRAGGVYSYTTTIYKNRATDFNFLTSFEYDFRFLWRLALCPSACICAGLNKHVYKYTLYGTSLACIGLLRYAECWERHRFSL